MKTSKLKLKARCGQAIANRMGTGQLYRTYRLSSSGQAIQCLVCGKISFNRMDAANLYCAQCNKFHVPGLPVPPEAAP